MTGYSPREALAQLFDARGLAASAQLAHQVGVTVRQLANAMRARPTSTTAYLRLCIGLGLDPLPEIPHKAPAEPRDFDHEFFAMAVRMNRILKAHNERQAAKEMGISHVTVFRMEIGDKVSIGVIIRACRYIGQHPFAFLKVKSQSTTVTATVSREIPSTVGAAA